MSKRIVKLTDNSTYAITAEWENCIGCQTCVNTCKNISGLDIFSTISVGVPPNVTPRYPARTASSTVVSLDTERHHTNNETDRVQLANTNCDACGLCAASCPVSALHPYEGDLADTIEALRAKKQGKRMKCVAFVAPSVRVGISELVGLPTGTSVPRQLAAALKECGFDIVLDVDWGADLTTITDTETTLKARETGVNRPTLTSCCPAWVNMAENRYSAFLNYISPSCSCVEMAARCVRKYLKEPAFIIDIMPCTAKKQEARRPQQSQTSGIHRGQRNIDACLTVIELYKLLQTFAPSRIPFENKNDDEYPPLDSPMGISDTSSGSTQYARTAGVAENVLRQISFLRTGNPMSVYDSLVISTMWQPFPDNPHIGIKKLNCVLDGEEFTALVAKGGVACIHIIDMLHAGELKDVDIVEMMTCPGGCMGGAGMPKIRPHEFNDILSKRIHGIKKLDQQISQHSGRVGGQNIPQKEILKTLFPDLESLRNATHTSFCAWDDQGDKFHSPSPPPIASSIGGLI